MRAVAIADGLTYSRDWPAPELQPGQALIRVTRAGICNTDLELVRGYLNFSGILGHEFVGEVVAGDSEWVGKHVVGEINVSCGDCDLCHEGYPTQCRNRTTVGIDRHDGAMADYIALTTNNLHVVPDGVSDDEAVFTEPLAAALQILECDPVSPNDDVILIGAGKLGLLCAQVLHLTGARVKAVVRRPQQAELLTGWGIEPVAYDDLPRGHAHVVVDCTGTAEGFSAALGLVSPRGTIHLKSTYAGLPQADLTRVVVDEIRLIGSRCGPFPAALRLLASRRVDVQSLIAARYPLDDALAAFEHAARPGMLKVLLEVT
jgi:threonine dehydrogenase-like Zn-dependent dehydrogenase